MRIHIPYTAYLDSRDPAHTPFDFDEAWDAECEQADRDYENREIEKFERERE